LRTLEILAWGGAAGYLLRTLQDYVHDIVKAKRDARARIAEAHRRAARHKGE
jgi:hypothetical protein